MNAEIIYIGSEFLSNSNAIKSASYLTNKLAAMGITVSYHTAVTDNTLRIENAIKTASERSNIIITMGGFDNLNSSLPLEIIANAFSIPLVLNENIYNSTKSYFDSIDNTDDTIVTRLSMLPQKCAIFQNDNNFIPGYAFAKNNNLFVLLPDDNAQLTTMFDNQVQSFLERVLVGGNASHTFNVFGINDEKINELLSELPSSPNINIQVSSTGIESMVRVLSYSNDKSVAQANIEPYIQQIRTLLGTAIFSENSNDLQQTVIALLRRKALTISTAESCTAGLISKQLTEVPGSSEVFLCGVAAYSNSIKEAVLDVKGKTIEQYGAVSSETAAAMAIGVKKLSKAAIGVSVTGIAGPGGGSPEKPVGLVYIALTDGGRVWIQKIQAAKGRDREYVRELASATVLDLTRRYLEYLPEIMPGFISLNTYKTNEEFIDAVTPASAKKKRNDQLEVIAVVDDEQNNARGFKKLRRKQRW